MINAEKKYCINCLKPIYWRLGKDKKGEIDLITACDNCLKETREVIEKWLKIKFKEKVI